MTSETVLSNARVVLGEEVIHGSVLIRDGLIADIGGPGAGDEDLDGDHLLPGLVELHTDHLEYHFNPRPGVQWDPLPAVLASDAGNVMRRALGWTLAEAGIRERGKCDEGEDRKSTH